MPAAAAPTASKHPRHGQLDALLKANIKNVVVIYLENRSFNNLYGNFPGVAQPLSAVRPEQALQRDRDGQPLSGLPKIWGGLVPTGQTVAGKRYFIEEKTSTACPTRPSR